MGGAAMKIVTERYELYQGDCLEWLSGLKISKDDVIIVDPPYPDYHIDLYQQTPIDFLSQFDCLQLVFWSAKVEFPLTYSAIHIWDKRVGCGSEYERIYERNGNHNYRMFRHYFINSTVAASFTGDTYTGHPSQKPLNLMVDLIDNLVPSNAIIYDFFMGSGSTGVAAIKTKHKFVGWEVKPGYFAIAAKRCADAYRASMGLPKELRGTASDLADMPLFASAGSHA